MRLALQTLRALALGRQQRLRLRERLALGVERGLETTAEAPLVLQSGLRTTEGGAQLAELVFRPGRLELWGVAVESTAAGVGNGPGHLDSAAC